MDKCCRKSHSHSDTLEHEEGYHRGGALEEEKHLVEMLLNAVATERTWKGVVWVKS